MDKESGFSLGAVNPYAASSLRGVWHSSLQPAPFTEILDSETRRTG